MARRECAGCAAGKDRSAGRCRAFTLIELLVVVSIPELMPSLLMSTLRLVCEAAQQTSCVSRMKQVGLALAYNANKEGYFPARWETKTHSQSHAGRATHRRHVATPVRVGWSGYGNGPWVLTPGPSW